MTEPGNVVWQSWSGADGLPFVSTTFLILKVGTSQGPYDKQMLREIRPAIDTMIKKIWRSELANEQAATENAPMHLPSDRRNLIDRCQK